jgi:hypothetical protein
MSGCVLLGARSRLSFAELELENKNQAEQRPRGSPEFPGAPISLLRASHVNFLLCGQEGIGSSEPV